MNFRAEHNHQYQVDVVVPCYNEEARIGASLVKLLRFDDKYCKLVRIRVVDDGSTDGTQTIVRNYAESDSRIELVSLPYNQGEGAAVRRGIKGLTSEWVLVTDADLSTPIEELVSLLRRAAPKHDVILGSRKVPGSRIHKRQPRFRQWMGIGWRALVKAIVLEDIYDAQCGFKVFRRTAAEKIFSRQLVNSYAFHVETIVLARLEGFSVCELPVIWSHAKDSRVSVLIDPLKMMVDLIRIRHRFRKRHQIGL